MMQTSLRQRLRGNEEGLLKHSWKADQLTSCPSNFPTPHILPPSSPVESESILMSMTWGSVTGFWQKPFSRASPSPPPSNAP